MSEIPQAAITVAIAALHRNRCSCDGGDGIICEDWHRRAAITALEAAAPLITSHREAATADAIARAERERIRRLAVEHGAKAAKCSAGVAPHPSRPCACRTANPAFPFADLLTEG